MAALTRRARRRIAEAIGIALAILLSVLFVIGLFELVDWVLANPWRTVIALASALALWGLWLFIGLAGLLAALLAR